LTTVIQGSTGEATVIQGSTGEATVIQGGTVGPQGIAGPQGASAAPTDVQYSDVYSDFIINGINPTVPSPASMAMTIPTGEAVVLGQRTILAQAVLNTYPASSDTYASLNQSGMIAFASVANGAAAPAAPANAINLLKVVTSAAAITGINNVTPRQPRFTIESGSAANIISYGADPTGVADSTEAFQAALGNETSIFIPAGTFSISSNLTINNDVCIYGHGPKSIISFIGGCGFVCPQPAGQNTVTLLNFTIEAGSSSAVTIYTSVAGHSVMFIISDMRIVNNVTYAINALGMWYSVIQNCVIGGAYGIYLGEACVNNQISCCNLLSQSGSIGILISGTGTDGVQGVSISDCVVLAFDTDIIIEGSTDFIVLNGCVLDQAANETLIIRPYAATGVVPENLSFSDCYFGSNSTSLPIVSMQAIATTFTGGILAGGITSTANCIISLTSTGNPSLTTFFQGQPTTGRGAFRAINCRLPNGSVYSNTFDPIPFFYNGGGAASTTYSTTETFTTPEDGYVKVSAAFILGASNSTMTYSISVNGAPGANDTPGQPLQTWQLYSSNYFAAGTVITVVIGYSVGATALSNPFGFIRGIIDFIPMSS